MTVALDRRALLRFGAVTVLAPQALIAAACAPQGPDAAHAPWTLWDAPQARGTPLALVAAGILAAEVHMGYPGVRAWLPYLIVVPLTALLLWRFGHAKVEVRDGELWAGEAHLPLAHIGEIRVVPATMKRKALGPGFDPAAYALTRSWIGPMVWIQLTDPADPTPYWLISTRSPEQLADALRSD